MSDDGDGARRQIGGLRHWGGFLASGLIALSVDASLLEVGVRLLSLDPLVARLGAISLAMVAGWLAHRRLTFALDSPASLPEFLKYLAAGWLSAAVNYSVFAIAIVAVPKLPRLGALILASTVAMIFSYAAMRYGVFARSLRQAGDGRGAG